MVHTEALSVFTCPHDTHRNIVSAHLPSWYIQEHCQYAPALWYVQKHCQCAPALWYIQKHCQCTPALVIHIETLSVHTCPYDTYRNIVSVCLPSWYIQKHCQCAPALMVHTETLSVRTCPCDTYRNIVCVLLPSWYIQKCCQCITWGTMNYLRKERHAFLLWFEFFVQWLLRSLKMALLSFGSFQKAGSSSPQSVVSRGWQTQLRLKFPIPID